MSSKTCKHRPDFSYVPYRSPRRELWTPVIQEIHELHRNYPELARGNRIFLSRTTYPESPQLDELQEVLAWCGFEIINPYHFRKLGYSETEWDFLKDILLRCDYFVALLDCFGGGVRQVAGVTENSTELLTIYDSTGIRFPVQTICQWEFFQAHQLWQRHNTPAIIPFLTQAKTFRPVRRDPTRAPRNDSVNGLLVDGLDRTCTSQAAAIEAIKNVSTVQGGEWDGRLIQSVLLSLRREMRRRAEHVHVRLGEDFRKEWREIHRDLNAGGKRPLVAICGDGPEHVRPSLEIARFLPPEYYETVTLSLPQQIRDTFMHESLEVRKAGETLLEVTKNTEEIKLFASERAPGPPNLLSTGDRTDFDLCEKILARLLPNQGLPGHAEDCPDDRHQIESMRKSLRNLTDSALSAGAECSAAFDEDLAARLNAPQPGGGLQRLAQFRTEEQRLGSFGILDITAAERLIRDLGVDQWRRLGPFDAIDPHSVRLGLERIRNSAQPSEQLSDAHLQRWLQLDANLERAIRFFLAYTGFLKDREPKYAAEASAEMRKVRQDFESTLRCALITHSTWLEKLHGRLIKFSDMMRTEWLPGYASHPLCEKAAQADYFLLMISASSPAAEPHWKCFTKFSKLALASEEATVCAAVVPDINSSITENSIAEGDSRTETYELTQRLERRASNFPNQLRHVSRRRLPEECLAMLLAARRQELLDSKRKLESYRRVRSERHFWYILGGAFALFALLQFKFQPAPNAGDAWRDYLPLGLALLGLVSLIIGFETERRNKRPD